ncbi:hypothetical protein ICE98_00116 [Lactococcus lactis]|nr:hypothetical protein [Lactococcus lactis]
MRRLNIYEGTIQLAYNKQQGSTAEVERKTGVMSTKKEDLINIRFIYIYNINKICLVFYFW